MENLRKVKKATISWALEKKLKEDKELRCLEKLFLEGQVNSDRSFLSKETREELVQLEL
jgi:hypothetical protein